MRSSPICAPVGGRPEVAISGHTTGVCSEVIRHTDSGASAAARPRPRPRGPRRGTGTGNGPRSLAAVSTTGTAGGSPSASTVVQSDAEGKGGGRESGVLRQVQPQRHEAGGPDGGRQPAA